MKTIVAGSRSITDRKWVYDVLDSRRSAITEVVCGMALHWLWKEDREIGGADRYAYDWAHLNDIPVAEFKPDWTRGKGAGLNRNCDMARYAEFLIAFHENDSTGTAHMIKIMEMMGKPVIVEKQDFMSLFA